MLRSLQSINPEGLPSTKKAEAKEAKTACNNAKHVAKHAIWLAQDGEHQENAPCLISTTDAIFIVCQLQEKASPQKNTLICLL